MQATKIVEESKDTKYAQKSIILIVAVKQKLNNIRSGYTRGRKSRLANAIAP